jgi:hypothetical protein
MAIDKVDHRIAKRDPANSLEQRSLRILGDEIARLERQLSGLKFVYDVMARHAK